MSQHGADYSLGLAFGRVVQAQPLRHPGRLNAVLADLLAGDLSLRAPLRELVELPAFLEAEPLVASATAVALVSFLLDELKSIYRDETLARLRQVLLGYFAIPEAKAESAGTPSADHRAKRDYKVPKEQIEKEKEPKKPTHIDARFNDVEQRKEILKKLLECQHWKEADRHTWALLAASCGGGDQMPFELIWRAVPCALLYDVNRLWCEASNFRFGFSVQRALWEALLALSSSANPSSGSGSVKQPAQIFAEFLQSPTSLRLDVPISVHSSAVLVPGFYPRGGMHRRWDEHQGWQMSWDGNCLISHFAEVHARLVDCGLVGVSLDAVTRKQLKALHQGAAPAPSAQLKAEAASAREPAQAKQPAAQPAMPQVSRPNQNSTHYTDKIYLIVVLWALFTIFLMSLAGPTVKKACYEVLSIYVRGFCYLWHVPSGLTK